MSSSSSEEAIVLKRQELKRHSEHLLHQSRAKKHRTLKHTTHENTNLPWIPTLQQVHNASTYQALPMSELIQHYSHLQLQTASPVKLENESEQSGSNDHHQRQYYINPQTHPDYLPRLEAYKRLFPSFRNNLNNLSSTPITTQILQSDLLNNPRPVLDIRTATLESKLLYESGKFILPSNGKLYDWPRCRLEQECVSYIYYKAFRGLEHPVIGTSHMSQSTYDYFVEHGKLPPSRSSIWVGAVDDDEVMDREPCVNCHRFYLSSLIFQDRKLCMMECESLLMKPKATASGSSASGRDMEMRCVQIYRNLMEEEGGYRKEFVDSFTSKETGMIQPMVKLNLATILVLKNTRSNRWQFVQNNLVWTKDDIQRNIPQATIGETVKVF